MSWIGRKKLAFVPLYRPHAHPPDLVPSDWSGDILRRVFYDPDQAGNDQSLRTYINKISSGRADLDAVVRPMQTLDAQDVPPDALDAQIGAQLHQEGFDAAALVMLGGVGAGSTSGYWVRFVMLEQVGVWGMEFMHSLTGFGDLYPFGGNMGAFDQMACACGTHPSAYTKAAIGWLDATSIVLQQAHAVAYDLHAIGLDQPPPSGRVAAVRLGTSVPYLMIEARLRVDQFDRRIPGEGVIVYRVQTPDTLGHPQGGKAPVQLLTTTALNVGQTFTADNGAEVQVTRQIPGGFSVTVENPVALVQVPDVTELPAVSAAHIIQNLGLVPKFTGNPGPHSWVFSQNPAAGQLVAKGNTVRMVLHFGPPP
jgi:hypothetical protein